MCTVLQFIFSVFTLYYLFIFAYFFFLLLLLMFLLSATSFSFPFRKAIRRKNKLCASVYCVQHLPSTGYKFIKHAFLPYFLIYISIISPVTFRRNFHSTKLDSILFERCQFDASSNGKSNDEPIMNRNLVFFVACGCCCNFIKRTSTKKG